MVPDIQSNRPLNVPDVLMDFLHEFARLSWAEAKEIRATGGHDSHAEGVYVGRAEACEEIIKAITRPDL